MAPLADLERGLDQSVPRTLWQIDRQEPACVKPRGVDLGIATVKTPTLSCRIVGQATRGKVSVSGQGQRLFVTMPVHAEVSVRDVAGVAGATATGTAIAHATVRLRIVGNWEPDATADISYRWSQPPGVTVLGQRIDLTQQADEKLAGVVAKLERELPQELAKLHLRQQLDGVWRQAFTTVSLNRENPPAWMRISPQRLGFGGYSVEGRNLRLSLAADAVTETFVGHRPTDPTSTALPPPSPNVGAPGLRFFIPVLADYAQLEPVVQRALRKLAAKGITLTGVGPVDAKFGDVTVYATNNGRLAIGVKAKVKARGPSLGGASGEIWLTALPYNAPGSQLVQAREVQFATRTDSSVVNLLVALFSNPAVQASVAAGLSHDFAPDYQKVLRAAQKAISDRQEGDFRLSAHITGVENGAIKVTGAGLFMPVRATGQAEITYHPR